MRDRGERRPIQGGIDARGCAVALWSGWRERAREQGGSARKSKQPANASEGWDVSKELRKVATVLSSVFFFSTMVLNGAWQSAGAGADGRARPFGVSLRRQSGPATSPAADDSPPVVPFKANAWRTRFALTPIASEKWRDKVGAALNPTFCFLPPAAGGPYIDLERAEPPPPIADTEWS